MDKLKEILLEELKALEKHFCICGVVDQHGVIYPLGADTKVLSTIFELTSRPAVYRAAERLGLSVREPDKQNVYPDFTLYADEKDQKKIAIDVKTTYRVKKEDTFSYTLGGYTSFIRPGNEKKNIVYPFNEYAAHWVIGFVYDRVAQKKAAANKVYELKDYADIPLPFENVEYFVQEKWRISGASAGSGNTTNIGSIEGRLDDFRQGRGPFSSEDEFLAYWRGYGRTAADRKSLYSTVEAFRASLKKA